MKQGILHDYDLMANQEESAREQTCIICGVSPMAFQWSDYSGEAMCTQCGFPYQLKWGTDEQQAEGKYPYPNIAKKHIPIIKEYWNETHKFACLGSMLCSPQPGLAEMNEWIEKNHPELINTQE